MVAPHVRTLFELKRAGLSDKMLAQKFNALGVIGSDGKKKRLGNTAVQKLTKSKFYIGIMEVKGWGSFKGSHETFIPVELFESVQPKKKPTLARKKFSDIFPLRGLLLDIDYHQMTGSTSKGRHGGHYHYYHCQRNEHRSKAEIVNGEFVELLKKIQPPNEAIELYKRVVFERIQDDLAFKEQRIDELHKRRKLLENKNSNLLDLIAEGDISKDVYRTRSKEIKDQLLAIDQHMAELQTESDQWALVVSYSTNFVKDLANNGYHLTQNKRHCLGVRFLGRN